MLVRISAFLVSCGLCLAAGQGLDEARKLYNLTNFERSVKILQALPEKDAAVYELMGRDYYMLADYKKATEALEKAEATDPDNARNRPVAGARLRPPRGNFQPVHRARVCHQRRASSSSAPCKLNPRNCRGFKRPVRVLPGCAWLPGRRPGQSAGPAGEDCGGGCQPKAIRPRPDWPRKRQQFGSAEEHLRQAHQRLPAAHRALHRTGQAAGQTGALPGRRN